jgi:hypothetical protein
LAGLYLLPLRHFLSSLHPFIRLFSCPHFFIFSRFYVCCHQTIPLSIILTCIKLLRCTWFIFQNLIVA